MKYRPRTPMTNVDAQRVAESVARHYHYNLSRLQSLDRDRQISHARHVLAFILYEVCRLSYPRVGKLIHRDHKTIVNSVGIIRANPPPELPLLISRYCRLTPPKELPPIPDLEVPNAPDPISAIPDFLHHQRHEHVRAQRMRIA